MDKLKLAIAMALGLQADSTEETLLAAFNADQANKNKLAEDLAANELKLKLTEAEGVFALALAQGKAAVAQKEAFLKLACLDMDSAKAMLNLGAAPTPLAGNAGTLPPSATELLQLANRGNSGAPANPNGPTKYELMLKEGTLLNLKKNNPDEFKRLEDEYIAAKGSR